MVNLETVTLSSLTRPNGWGLAADVAELLAGNGRAGGALEIYDGLLRQMDGSEPWQRFLVERAVPLAESEGDQGRLA